MTRRLVVTLLLICIYMGSSYAEELSFKMSGSEIYPGTERVINVFVPDCYTGDKPACLLVRMDWWNKKMLDDMEELMHSGEMPVTIGVLIDPGKIYAPDGSVIRYNRSNEYDRTDSRFAEFLENEVLPNVCRMVTSDGRKVMISERPEDRALYGDSSGGIASFCAAWFRPDLFSRVYSAIGTFVPMRGGDQIAPLVRKTEPKPVRVFLQDNDQDSWNLLLGSWYEENVRLFGALQFAGYEVAAVWDKGGHSGDNGLMHFKEAMRFLWAGWPERVGTGVTGNKTMIDIIPEGSAWRVSALPAKDIFKNKPCRKAVYPGGGQVSTLQRGSNWVLNAIRDDKGHALCEEEFYYLHGQPREICYDASGYLYAATGLGVEICDHNGRVRAILAAPCGKSVTRVRLIGNTLYVLAGGTLYERPLLRCGFDDFHEVPAPEKEYQG